MSPLGGGGRGAEEGAGGGGHWPWAGWGLKQAALGAEGSRQGGGGHLDYDDYIKAQAALDAAQQVWCLIVFICFQFLWRGGGGGRGGRGRDGGGFFKRLGAKN